MILLPELKPICRVMTMSGAPYVYPSDEMGVFVRMQCRLNPKLRHELFMDVVDGNTPKREARKSCPKCYSPNIEPVNLDDGTEPLLPHQCTDCGHEANLDGFNGIPHGS